MEWGYSGQTEGAYCTLSLATSIGLVIMVLIRTAAEDAMKIFRLMNSEPIQL